MRRTPQTSNPILRHRGSTARRDCLPRGLRRVEPAGQSARRRRDDCSCRHCCVSGSRSDARSSARSDARSNTRYDRSERSDLLDDRSERSDLLDDWPERPDLLDDWPERPDRVPPGPTPPSPRCNGKRSEWTYRLEWRRNRLSPGSERAVRSARSASVRPWLRPEPRQAAWFMGQLLPERHSCADDR